MTKYANITVVNIPWPFLFCKTVLSLWINKNKYWVLLPHKLDSKKLVTNTHDANISVVNISRL